MPWPSSEPRLPSSSRWSRRAARRAMSSRCVVTPSTRRSRGRARSAAKASSARRRPLSSSSTPPSPCSPRAPRASPRGSRSRRETSTARRASLAPPWPNITPRGAPRTRPWMPSPSRFHGAKSAISQGRGPPSTALVTRSRRGTKGAHTPRITWRSSSGIGAARATRSRSSRRPKRARVGSVWSRCSTTRATCERACSSSSGARRRPTRRSAR
jgi:hypothetical protein